MKLGHVAALGLSLSLVSCGVFGADDPATEGSSGGTPDQNAKPPGVDGAPLEGVFVSSSRGNDATGDGTEGRPLASIGAGLRKGQTDKKRVLVCAETYGEQITVLDGVSMYGYFDCSGPAWKLDESKRAKVAPPKSPVVRAENVQSATRIEGFELVGPDLGPRTAADEGPFAVSSVAVFATGSKSLVLSKSLVAGGHGADGVDGLGGGVVTVSAARSAERGKNEGFCAAPLDCGNINSSPNPGGLGGLVKCDGADGNPGGDGGTGCHKSGGAPTACFLKATGSAGTPIPATAQTAAGGPLVSVDKTFGLNGSDGAVGSVGKAGESGVITFGPQGIVVTDGSPGEAGGHGHGGGGGGGLGWGHGSLHELAASGGGGGAGGCGGRKATQGGSSGGASVALYLVASTVTLERVTARGGTGGRAGAGQPGGPGSAGIAGGAPGDQYTSNLDCFDAGGNRTYCTAGRGGKGGDGGKGGASGHGASGASFAVVQVGATELKQDADSKLEAGKGGAGAPAIAGTTVAAMPDGPADGIFKQP